MAETTEQSEFWDERAEAWARHADGMEAFVDQFGGPAMDLFDPMPGQHVADIGCGPGLTTLELGRRVGSDGSATGVDVSARMVQAATDRAAAGNVTNVRFETGDPGSGPMGPFDGIYSRFGIMFFDEPSTAFTNISRSIEPGGRFVAVAWAELDANPWMFLPTLFGAGPLRAELALPGPDEPGPFSLADPVRTTTLLRASGFEDVDVVRHEHSWTFDAGTAADAIVQMVSVGPLAQAWAEADDEARAATLDAIRTACEEHRDHDRYQIPAAAFTISASVAPSRRRG